MVLDIDKKTKEILMMNDYDSIQPEYQKLLLSKNSDSFEILLKLLASGSVSHVQEAARILALKGDPKYIEKMLDIKKHLQVKGGLWDYRTSIDNAILILQERKMGNECNCNIYPKTSFHPQYEADTGFIKIVNKSINEDTVYMCVCSKCGRKWQVIEDLSYHYPIFGWTTVSND